MSGFKPSHWMMLAGAVAVTVLLLLAPRTPKGAAEENAAQAASARVSEDPSSGSTPRAIGAEALSTDPQVNAILEKLNAGGAPMQAILELRTFADEHPDNVEAQWHLGLFSWQTGQYDKAMERFKKVVALDPVGHADAYAWLGRAYAAIDSTEQAIAAYEKFKTSSNDPELIHAVDSLLQQLKQH